MSTGIRLMVVGGEEARARLAAMPERVNKAMRAAMGRSLNIIHRRVTENLTGRVLNVKTGRLRRVETAVSPDGTRGMIGTNVEYAEIHEYGGQTPPHRIEARRKRALRFPAAGFAGSVRLTKAGKLARRQSPGAVIMVQAVEHPGSTMPARPFMRPALEDSRDEIAEILRAGLGELLQKGRA